MIAMSVAGCAAQVPPGAVDETVRPESTATTTCISYCDYYGNLPSDPWGTPGLLQSGYIVTGSNASSLPFGPDTIFLGVSGNYNVVQGSGSTPGSWFSLATEQDYATYERWRGTLNKAECYAPSMRAYLALRITAPAPGGLPPGGGSDPKECGGVVVCVDNIDLDILRTSKECQVVPKPDPPEKCHGKCI